MLLDEAQIEQSRFSAGPRFFLGVSAAAGSASILRLLGVFEVLGLTTAAARTRGTGGRFVLRVAAVGTTGCSSGSGVSSRTTGLARVPTRADVRVGGFRA